MHFNILWLGKFEKMKALARLVLGFFIFDAAVTAPTLEPINYDSETYDATVEDLDNLYNYENIPIGQAEVTFGSIVWGITEGCSLQVDFCLFINRDVLS